MCDAITKLFANSAQVLDERMYALDEWSNYCEYNDHALCSRDRAELMHCLRWYNFAHNERDYPHWVSENTRSPKWKAYVSAQNDDPYADDIPF
jgi:hypothetical protein